jgi:hypothetical protein
MFATTTTTNTMNTNTSTTKKMAKSNKFCTVCKNAGLSEKEYTNHFVRDVPGPHGKVVCPTLLKLECSYCFKTGHTKSEKYCPAFRKMLFETNRRYSAAVAATTTTTTPKRQERSVVQCLPVHSNPYKYLEDIDVSIGNENHETSSPLHQIPTPVTKQATLHKNVKHTSYASMANKPVEIKREEDETNSCYTLLGKTNLTGPYYDVTKIIKKQDNKKYRVTSWSHNDQDDTDEEEDAWM